MSRSKPDWKFFVGLSLASAIMLGGVFAEKGWKADATPLGDEERQAALHQEFEKRKQAALNRCYDDGGAPALGFGFTVVCIRRQDVTEYDPANDVISTRVTLEPEP